MIKNFKNLYQDNFKVFSNINSLMTLQLLNYAFPLITMPYLIKTLGLSNYGILIFSQVIATYFVRFTNYGFYILAPKLIAQNKHNIKIRNHIITQIFLTKFIFMIASLILIILIIQVTPTLNDHKEVFLISMLLVVNELIFASWFFQGIEKMRKITQLSVIGRCVAVILMFLLVTGPDDLAWAALTQSLGGFIAGVISLKMLFKKYNFRPTSFSYLDILETIKKGWNLFLSQVSSIILANVNVTMLGALSSPETISIYAIGEKVVRMASSLTSPITSALFPNISILINRSLPDGILKLKNFLIYGTIFFLIVCSLLFLTSNIITYYLTGSANIESSSIIKIMFLLPLVIFIKDIYGVQYMLNLGLEALYRNVLIFSSVLLIIFSYVFIKSLSAYGAAISLIIVEIIGALLMIFYVEIKKGSHRIIRANKI